MKFNITAGAVGFWCKCVQKLLKIFKTVSRKVVLKVKKKLNKQQKENHSRLSHFSFFTKLGFVEESWSSTN